MAVDVPLVILAVTFLLSLFALVAFVATVVKAAARRRRRVTSPAPEWSAPFALPAGSFDPSLDGLRVEVPVSAPSAVLFTPIRTGDWLPEPVPGAPGFVESRIESVVVEPAAVQAIPEVIPQISQPTVPISVVQPQPVAVPQPAPVAPQSVPVPQPMPVAPQPVPVPQSAPVAPAVVTSPPEPPHVMQPTQPIPAVVEAPAAPVSVSPGWVEDDDFDARIAALLPQSQPIAAEPQMVAPVPEPVQQPEPPQQSAPEPVSYEFMIVPEVAPEPAPQPVVPAAPVVQVPEPVMPVEVPMVVPVVTVPAAPVAIPVPESVPSPTATPTPTPTPSPVTPPAEAEPVGEAGVEAALEMFGEEWQGLIKPPPARAVAKPPVPRPEVRIATPPLITPVEVTAVVEAPVPVPEVAPLPVQAPRPVATVASPAAERPVQRPRPADVPPLEMAAPVEMWFGDARVGVKAGTATYERFRRFADVMLKDLHEVKANPRA